MTRYFEEFVVNEVSVSGLRTITDGDLRAFASLTGDWNQIHLSDEAARQNGYDRRFAHGALIFGLSMGLLQADNARQPNIIALVGVERMRFLSPVFPDEAICVRQTVRSLDPVSLRAGLLEAAVEILDQGQAPRMTYTAKFLVRRAP
jgi:3-hydroxybutyryl-CoA dehydratase